MELDEIEDTTLDELLQNFETSVTNALGEYVPEKKINIAVRDQRPWYTRDLRMQLRTVRNRERIWRKYKEDEHWMAYKAELSIYSKLLYKTEISRGY